MGAIASRVAGVAVALLALVGVATAQAPAEKLFAPPGGKGRPLLAVSGQSGPDNYVPVAKDLAAQGFLVSLIDGNDVFKPNNAGEPGFKAALARVQGAPNATPGKVAVVGFSLGGGAVLTYAARAADQVAAVVAYYPYTSFIQNPAAFAGAVKTPVLMLAAVKDSWKDCCKIDMARSIAAASPKPGGAALIEIVEYANADHAFILKGPFFRQPDAADALKRTVAFLRKAYGDPAAGDKPKTN